MTALAHLLARAADRLLGRPRVDLAARLAPWTLDAPGPAPVPSPVGPGVTARPSNLKERT